VVLLGRRHEGSGLEGCQTMNIKAIQTEYKGYRFRSRTEARWAVYFDYLKIKWEYEKEGYDLGSVGYYLPDFWLPEFKYWAEVKPEKLNLEEEAKIIRLVGGTKHPCLLLIGSPDVEIYKAINYKEERMVSVDYDELSYAIINHHGENRFFFAYYKEEIESFNEIINAVNASRSARFEHKEKL
jgi:hypothetical protein